MSVALDHEADTRQAFAVAPAIAVEPESDTTLLPRWLRSGRWVLACIIGAKVIGSLRLRNSAFQDEALYLWAGRQITSHLQHGTPLYGNFSSYFSGSPGIYPVVASLADSVAGVAGALAFSVRTKKR